jgi:sarcosine oxidase
LGVPLVVTRQVLGWVEPESRSEFAPDRFPCWAIERPDGSLYYGVPSNDFEPGLKIAHHHRGASVDPDADSRTTTPNDEATIERITREALPSAGGKIAELRICLYTNSPDSHFIVGPHPRDPRIVLACGFSGHGFKFASVMGEVLAELATTGLTKLPIQFLSPERFEP